MTDKRRLNKSAHQKPSTVKPLTSLLATQIINTLMTKRNSPNVKIVIGKVSIIKTGFNIAFRMANTIANTSAVQKVSI